MNYIIVVCMFLGAAALVAIGEWITSKIPNFGHGDGDEDGEGGMQ